MKRRIVKYDTFAEIKENSMANSMKELIEAEEHLSRTLDIGDLKLSSFDESSVIYEHSDGTYLRANYSIDKNKIHFDDIEQLVIDEESEKQESRDAVRKMVEAILDDNEVEANKSLEKYLELTSKRYQREHTICTEAVIEEGAARLYGSPSRTKGKSTPVISYRTGSKDPVKVRAARKGHQKHKSSYAMGGRKRHRNLSRERARRPRYEKLHSKLRALNVGKSYTGKR